MARSLHQQSKGLEKQWRDAKARFNRWLPDRETDDQAREICRVEDERMRKLERKLGYVPK